MMNEINNEMKFLLLHVDLDEQQLRLRRLRLSIENAIRNNSEDDVEECNFDEMIEALLVYNLELRLLIAKDVYCFIQSGSPIHLQAERVTRQYASRNMHLTREYWTITHPNLNDDDGPNSYKAHYRINKRTFVALVNIMMNSPHYLGSQTSGGYPIYVQVAIVLWRFANCHFGYRIAKVFLGVTHGSYNNFTNRFINAMVDDCTRHFIQWPKTPQEIQDTTEGFEALNGLKGCIGAVDGKLVVIHKPSENGNQYIDRKNNASMSVMAICDHRKRFTYLKVGHSGKLFLMRILKHCT